MQHLKRVSFWLSCVCVVALVFSLALVSSGALTTTQKTAAPSTASTSVKAYGAVGNKNVDDYNAIYQAVQAAAVNAAGGTVYFPAGEYLLGKTMTVPANVELVFAANSSIYLGSGVTLTVNGSIAAGDQCIFWGLGTVNGAPQNEALNPMWFGALDDGRDCSGAFQLALSMCNGLEVPNTQNGFILKQVNLNREQMNIYGRDGQKAKIVATADSTMLFNISRNNVTIKNLSIDMSRTNNASSTCFVLNDSAAGGALAHVFIDNIDANGAFCFARDSLVKEFTISNAHFSNLNLTAGRGSAFKTLGMYGFVFIEHSVIDYSTSSGITMNFPAIDITANQGMLIDNVTIKGQGNAVAGAHGIKGTNCEAMWFQNCKISGMGDCGIYLTRNDKRRNIYYYINNNDISYCSNGIQITDGYEAQIHQNVITNVRNAGIQLTGSKMQVSANYISGSNHGIESYATYSVFTENTTANNTGYGIYSTGSSCASANHASAGNGSGDRFVGTAVQHALPAVN